MTCRPSNNKPLSEPMMVHLTDAYMYQPVLMIKTIDTLLNNASHNQAVAIKMNLSRKRSETDKKCWKINDHVKHPCIHHACSRLLRIGIRLNVV